MSESAMKINVRMEGKSLIVAYLLWWFLGLAGVHRFYLGRYISGFVQLLLSLVGGILAYVYVGLPLLLIVLLWWALDAFLTYGMVNKENAKRGLNGTSVSLVKDGELDNLEKLEKLHALYEKGVVTKDEYEKKKAELI